MINVFKHDTFGNLFNLLGTKLDAVTTTSSSYAEIVINDNSKRGHIFYIPYDEHLQHFLDDVELIGLESIQNLDIYTNTGYCRISRFSELEVKAVDWRTSTLDSIVGKGNSNVIGRIILWNEKIEISLSQDSTMCYLKLKDSNLLYPLYFSKREK